MRASSPEFSDVSLLKQLNDEYVHLGPGKQPLRYLSSARLEVLIGSLSNVFCEPICCSKRKGLQLLVHLLALHPMCAMSSVSLALREQQLLLCLPLRRLLYTWTKGQEDFSQVFALSFQHQTFFVQCLPQ